MHVDHDHHRNSCGKSAAQACVRPAILDLRVSTMFPATGLQVTKKSRSTFVELAVLPRISISDSQFSSSGTSCALRVVSSTPEWASGPGWASVCCNPWQHQVILGTDSDLMDIPMWQVLHPVICKAPWLAASVMTNRAPGSS